MYAGVGTSEVLKGQLVFQNCTFYNSSATLIKAMYGGGGVFMLKGDSSCIIISKNCNFLDSGISIRGEIL